MRSWLDRLALYLRGVFVHIHGVNRRLVNVGDESIEDALQSSFPYLHDTKHLTAKVLQKQGR